MCQPLAGSGGNASTEENVKQRGILIVVGLVVAGLAAYWAFGRGSSSKRADHKNTTKKPATSKRQVKPRRAATKPSAAHGAVTRKNDGAPVAKAVVQLLATGDQTGREGNDEDLVVETDDKGQWKLGDIPPGEYSMSVTASGFLPAISRKISLRAGADESLDTAIAAGGNGLHGTVSDMTGGSVGSALIRLTPIVGILQPRRDRGFSAMSDTTGKYKLSAPDGRYRITCSHEAYVTSSRVIEIRGSERAVDFALSPGGVIEGTVLSATTGQPVSGAVVRYSRAAMRSMPGVGAMGGRGQGGVAKADKNGRFRVRGLRAGAISLRAHAQGAASRDPVSVPLGIAERVTNVELFVADAYSIAGKVSVKGSAKPAVGVWVIANARGGVALTSVVKTGADGSFEIDGALPGRYTLRVRGGAYVTPEVGTPVTVKEKDLAGVKLLVNEGAMISGRVEPAGAAEVGIKVGDPNAKGMGGRRMFEMLRVRSSVQTEDDGTFKLGPIRPGAITLVAKAADGRKGELKLDVPATGSKGVVVRLEDKASVSGHVVDEDGKPVTNTMVSLKPIKKGSHTTMIVNGRDITAEQSPTHEDGSFKIVGLDAGNYELSVKDQGGSRLAWARPKDKDRPTAAVAYKVEARRNHTGVKLRVEARNHSIKGVAIGPDGKPARDVWINASKVSQGMRMGGGPPMPPRPPSGGSSGAPQRRVTMMMVMDSDEDGGGGGGGGMGGGIAPVLTNEDGEFEIKNLRKGTYDLMGEGLRGTARGFLKGVKTGSSANLKLIALTKVKGVVTQDGKPVASFKVDLSGASRRSKWVRDKDGSFTLYRIDPGKYTVEITADAGSGKAEVTVEAGKTAEVKIDLQTLVKVTGKLVDPSGKPIANAKVLTGNASGGSVRIEMADGDAPSMTDADGKFELRLGKGGKVLLVMGEDKPGARVMHRFEIKTTDDLDLGEIKANW